MFYVYVLQNPKGILYKGYTADLQKRLKQHNAIDGFQSYTQSRGPWTLLFSEQFTSESEAKDREQFLKSGKGRQYLKELLGGYPPKADG